MPSQKELSADLSAVDAIKTITSVYQEIASIRMKQLRERVAKTREFLDGVSSVYNHAKIAYVASIQTLPFEDRKKKLASITFLRRNRRRVDIFLSANEHLYGTLILNIWEHFIKTLREEKSEAAVVGSFGRYLINNEKIDTKVETFDLDDDQPRPEQIKEIVGYISRYETVVVHHGQMISVINQITAKSEISGGVSFSEKVERSAKRYLFEPSPERILEFFESEIIGALFNQTILEHQLARFAARMVAMDTATENANHELKEIERQLQALRRRVLNRKQLQIFAGYSLWG